MDKIPLPPSPVYPDLEKVLDNLAHHLKGESPLFQLPYQIFAETVAQAPIAISITDKKSNIQYVNQEFVRVTGYESVDIIGQNESILSDKRTPRHVYYDLWHTISRKKIWQGRLINRHKNGRRYLSDLIIAPMLDEHEVVTHYIGMHRDITASYEAEKIAINQKQLIESVVNASPFAMVANITQPPKM